MQQFIKIFFQQVTRPNYQTPDRVLLSSPPQYDSLSCCVAYSDYRSCSGQDVPRGPQQSR